MQNDIYYQAMLARDYRFDGKFFIGVKTTGIYCRPICPAKPKRENVEFFLHALAAEKAGYRPCLRCRPESAPHSPVWQGKTAVVQRALKIIASAPILDANEDDFAAQFGITARHLRRLFKEEIGKTPLQINHDNRLNFARKLICETNLPVTAIALTAGFHSLRRFNDAFKKRFERAPRLLRKKKKHAQLAKGIELSLAYRPPLDWETLLSFYRSHQILGMETVTESTYERVFKIGEHVGHLKVRNAQNKSKLFLDITAEDPTILFSVAKKVRQMFDLDSDPLLVANSFQADKFLDSLWKKYPGLRLARGWDPLEAAIGTILGQLVSVSQAKSLMHQLVQHHGTKVIHPISGDPAFLFPDAKTLAAASLTEVKTTQARKSSIRELALRIARGEINLETPTNSEASKAALLSIRGIGPWSAEYICLRALGDTDAFPGSDLILKRAMEKHPSLDLETVRPWRAYAAIYLWKHYAKTLSKQKRQSNEICL